MVRHDVGSSALSVVLPTVVARAAYGIRPNGIV